MRHSSGRWAILPRDLHLWWIDADALAARHVELGGLLRPDEKEESRKFRHEQHRRRFVVRRAARNEILADYLGCRADQVQIEHSAFGQPRLMSAPETPQLSFSASHSHGLAVLVVGAEGRIGIDIERLRPMPDALAIARQHFTRDEAELLEKSNGSDRDAEFLAIWTAKEAFVKALGTGLSFPLDAIQVRLEQGKAVELTVEHAFEGGTRWAVSPASLDPRIVGAVVTEHSVRQFQWRRWE